MEIIWRLFDRWLDDPIRIEHSPRRRRIWVLDVAYFEVDRELRTVRGGVIDPTGQLIFLANFDLLAPLEDQRWFDNLVGRIFGRWPVGERFSGVTPNSIVRERGKAKARTWSRLNGDARFQAVAHTVRHEMGLDMAVWRLACEASIWWKELTAEEYQLAWQNLPAYRQVHAENPDLLALLPIFLTCHDDRFEGDPVREIKGWFRAHGLSEAAWRFLAKAGMVHFVSLLRRLQPSAQLSGLLRFLKIVEEMDFDTNLLDIVTEAWIDAIAMGAPFLSLQANWWRPHPTVLRVAYGASRDIGAWAGEERAKKLPAVLRWARDEGILLDRQQVRGGWSALEKRWQLERPEDVEGRATHRFEWTPPTEQVRVDELIAVPLRSTDELRTEAEAMGNCLGNGTYADACVRGQVAVYSIRTSEAGQRVAVASFVRNGTAGWILRELKGPMNSRPRIDSEKVARELEGTLRAGMRS